MQAQKPFPFLIGGDPEFNIITTQKKIIAENLIRTLNIRKTKEGGIGWDNHRATGEFWPSPTSTPREMVENLAFLIHKLNAKVPIATLTTSSKSGWIGGHIHLDVPDYMFQNWNDRIKGELGRTLNYFWLLPMMSENPVNITIRQNNGYGLMNKYQDRYFENDKQTYEFRVPTAEWLTYPKLAEATLTYMAAVWNEIINKNGISKFREIVFKNITQMDNVSTMVVSHYEPVVKTIFKNIIRAIKTLEFYPAYKRQIDYLFNVKGIMEEKEKLNYDIVKGWNTERLWFSEPVSFKDNDIEPDYNACGQNLPIYWNNDFNMAQVKISIEKQIIKQNIPMNRPFCFYGMKKGIEQFLVTDSNGIYEGIELHKNIKELQHTISLTERMQENCGSELKSIAIGIPYDLREKNKLSPVFERFFAFNNDITRKPTTWKEISINLQPPTPEQTQTTVDSQSMTYSNIIAY